MDKASLVLSLGADFRLLGGDHTMLKSKVPVVCCRRSSHGVREEPDVAQSLRVPPEQGDARRRPSAIRMPYGDLVKQRMQRYGSLADLLANKCTVEEMEEYEPHIVNGTIIYAGVDYQDILRQAEKEADVIVWDGGNNDMSFYLPDLTIHGGRSPQAGTRDDLLSRRDQCASCRCHCGEQGRFRGKGKCGDGDQECQDDQTPMHRSSRRIQAISVEDAFDHPGEERSRC